MLGIVQIGSQRVLSRSSAQNFDRRQNTVDHGQALQDAQNTHVVQIDFEASIENEADDLRIERVFRFESNAREKTLREASVCAWPLC